MNTGDIFPFRFSILIVGNARTETAFYAWIWKFYSLTKNMFVQEVVRDTRVFGG